MIFLILFQIEFVNAYLLLNHTDSSKAMTHRDRLNYVMDHNNPTPGKNNFLYNRIFLIMLFLSGYVTRDQGEQVFNRLNRFYT
jgi:hypothetical protein